MNKGIDPELDKKTIKLITKYQDAYEYLIKILSQKINKNLSTRHIQSIMAEIQSVLSELDVDAYKYCKEVLPLYYINSMGYVDDTLALLNLIPPDRGAVLHRKAIEQATNDTYTDLAGRTRFMSEQAKKTIRDTASELITRQSITGESRKTVVKDLRKGLEDKGVSSFVDNANRNWDIGRYSDMLLRTKSRILHSDGTMDRLNDYKKKYPHNDNFDYIQVSNHGSKDWCGEFEDCVFSISGHSDRYPPVSSLPNDYSILHPNCRHIFHPYIPALRDDGKIAHSQYLNRDIKSLNKEFYHKHKK